MSLALLMDSQGAAFGYTCCLIMLEWILRILGRNQAGNRGETVIPNHGLGWPSVGKYQFSHAVSSRAPVSRLIFS